MNETPSSPQPPENPVHDSEHNEPLQRVGDRIEHGIIQSLLENLSGHDGNERFKRYNDLLNLISSDRREV